MSRLVSAAVSSRASGQSAAEFLASLPRGAYTTARVLQNTVRVFEYERQLDRLVYSHQQLVAVGSSQSEEFALQLAILAVIEKTIADASSSMLRESDCKLTVHISSSSSTTATVNDSIHAHLEPMKKPRGGAQPIRVVLAPSSPAAAASVDAAASSRPAKTSRLHCAEAKDSQWVADRHAIVDSTAEETLLLTEDGTGILEGSQTNFFAVNALGQVITADQHVLQGTVRAAVLDACRALVIPVVFSPPLVSDIPTFKEAFLCSTSRLVMGIDSLHDINLPVGGDRPVTASIAHWVAQHVDARSISTRELLKKRLQ